MVYKDVRFDSKVRYLERLLGVYVRFLKYYEDVEVTIKKDTIEVKYCKAKNDGYLFQSIEFPKTDLNKRILHYKGKIRTMFKNRHTNPNWK